MKSLILLITLITFISCSLQVQETPINKAVAYTSGKALAVSINYLAPEADPGLTSAWVDLMERNEGLPEIPPSEMILFYNTCVSIVASSIKDPYGILGDLSTLLIIFSAEFDGSSGQMISINPIPTDIMKFFGKGYDSGRKVARKQIRGY